MPYDSTIFIRIVSYPKEFIYGFECLPHDRVFKTLFITDFTIILMAVIP
jgi:hypothetical protein